MGKRLGIIKYISQTGILFYFPLEGVEECFFLWRINGTRPRLFLISMSTYFAKTLSLSLSLSSYLSLLRERNRLNDFVTLHT